MKEMHAKKYVGNTKILFLLSRLFKCQAKGKARKPEFETRGLTGFNLKLRERESWRRGWNQRCAY